MSWLSLLAMTAAQVPGGPYQVEVMEESAVRLVPLDLGDAAGFTVDRARLPAELHEGDVLVDGRVDPQLTLLLRQQAEGLAAEPPLPWAADPAEIPEHPARAGRDR
jgi:hypothetical protein